METVYDIVTEMRSRTAKSKDKAWYDQSAWATLCDRIEIANCAEKIINRQEAYKHGYIEGCLKSAEDNTMKYAHLTLFNEAAMRKDDNKMLEALRTIDALLKTSGIGSLSMVATLATIAEVVNGVLADVKRPCKDSNKTCKDFDEPYKPMTLDEAIARAEEVASSDTPCGREHKQSADWLKELRNIKYSNMEKGFKSIWEETLQIDGRRYKLTNGKQCEDCVFWCKDKCDIPLQVPCWCDDKVWKEVK